MATTDQVMAAAGRLLRLSQVGGDYPAVEAVYPDGPVTVHVALDAVRVAKAWLAANPADDGEPYEPAWLATVGFRPAYNDVTGVTLTEGVHLHHVPRPNGAFYLTDGRFTFLKLPPLPTRGHVRKLLLALGVSP